MINSTKPPRFPHKIIVRAPGLLPMLYTLGELGAELNTPARTLYDWLGRGMPHNREDGRIWVNGREFATWVNDSREVKATPRLANDEAYCLRCRERVKFSNPTRRRIRGKQILLSATCSGCGGKVNKGESING